MFSKRCVPCFLSRRLASLPHHVISHMTATFTLSHILIIGCLTTLPVAQTNILVSVANNVLDWREVLQSKVPWRHLAEWNKQNDTTHGYYRLLGRDVVRTAWHHMPGDGNCHCHCHEVSSSVTDVPLVKTPGVWAEIGTRINTIWGTNQKLHRKYMDLLHCNRCELATCFGQLLWPSSGR